MGRPCGSAKPLGATLAKPFQLHVRIYPTFTLLWLLVESSEVSVGFNFLFCLNTRLYFLMYTQSESALPPTIFSLLSKHYDILHHSSDQRCLPDARVIRTYSFCFRPLLSINYSCIYCSSPIPCLTFIDRFPLIRTAPGTVDTCQRVGSTKSDIVCQYF